MDVLDHNNRRTVIWAASAHRLVDLFQQVSPNFSSRSTIKIINKGFDDAVNEIRKCSLTETCDVVVAAGAHGAYLRQHLNIPVSLVKVDGFDFMAALNKARQISTRIAVVMHRTLSIELQRFADFFGVPLELRAYQTNDDARHCIEELALKGIEVIVGPGLITNMAYEAGLIGILIYSTDSVQTAFENAINIATAKQVEKARGAQLNSVLRHLNDGVVGVDMNGRIVTINPAVETLSGRSLKNTIGTPLQRLLPEIPLGKALTSSDTELGRIIELAGRSIIVNRLPLFDDGVRTGTVFTLHGSGTLEQAVSNLRSHSHRRSRLAKYCLSDIIAESAEMQAVIEKCHVYANGSDATILITGDTGTGKELLAQGIHNASPRRVHPFIAVNCGAFTESLLESELFGYDDGTFTGGRQNGKSGLFEAAHKGTLFLDEIGDMPLPLQTRLLRVLQEKEIKRVGGIDAISIDVRILAATHQNLDQMIQDGTFREDLFYRLSILQIDIPPLRNRRDDIQALSRHLLQKSLKGRELEQADEAMLNAALPYLRKHHWPGNVRELENVIERLATARLISSQPLTGDIIQTFITVRSATPRSASKPTLTELRRHREAETAKAEVEQCGGDMDLASRNLGISRTTLWRKLKMLPNSTSN